MVLLFTQVVVVCSRCMEDYCRCYKRAQSLAMIRVSERRSFN